MDRKPVSSFDVRVLKQNILQSKSLEPPLNSLYFVSKEPDFLVIFLKWTSEVFLWIVTAFSQSLYLNILRGMLEKCQRQH